MLIQPAMSRAQAEEALAVGVDLAARAALEGCHFIGTGEMGIGNTTPSAAIASIMTGVAVEQVTGERDRHRRRVVSSESDGDRKGARPASSRCAKSD